MAISVTSMAGLVGMNATPETTSTRDFSDWALLRGALAAAFCAYLLIMVLYPSLFGAREFLDLDALLDRLSSAFQLVTLFMGLIFASAASVIGLMFLAASKRDHTTYRAAASAGAKAAGLIMGIVCLIVLSPGLLSTLASRPEEILSPAYLSGAAVFLSGALIVATTGAASGLIFRVVAGAPTVEQNPEA